MPDDNMREIEPIAGARGDAADGSGFDITHRAAPS